MRVLIIDGDEAAGGAIWSMCVADNMTADLALGAEDGAYFAGLYPYDIITVEASLPDMAGYDLVRKFRATSLKAPIIVMGRSSLVEDKVRAFSVGADDYVEKPFHSAELLARMRAIVRRTRGHASCEVKVGPLRIDMDERAARVEGRPVPLPLTSKEYELLEVLALRKGAFVTKATLLDQMYPGPNDGPVDKIIDVFVCRLRAKLTEAGVDSHKLLRTVWGRGYVLTEPTARVAA
jgi:two-component system cell cycle response regulator CtrA